MNTQWLSIGLVALAADETTQAATIMVVERALERLLIVLIGGLCVYFGFRLYFVVASQKATLEASAKGYLLKLRDVGPGAIFCLIGCSLLAWSIFVQPRYEYTYSGVTGDTSTPSASPKVSVSYAGALDANTATRIKREMHAIAFAKSRLAASANDHEAADPELEHAYKDLDSARLDLVRPYLSEDDVATYLQFNNADPHKVSGQPTQAQNQAIGRVEQLLNLGDTP